MFERLLKDIKETFGIAESDTTTLTFAKPYCTPARGIIEPVLKKYGVKVYGYTEEARVTNPRNLWRPGQRKNLTGPIANLPVALPIAQVAEVVVSKKAAAWAEYLLLRTGQLKRVGKFTNPKNAAWARQHGGKMPPAWEKGEPWIEKSCRKGIDQWKDARKILDGKQK
jgi:hypothetical protein